MAIFTIQSLTSALPGDRALLDIARKLHAQPPGIVLTTGQAVSGKVTMLLALALMLAPEGEEVLLLGNNELEFSVFEPLPPNWKRLVVTGDRARWSEALQAASVSSVLVVAPLDRESAPELWKVARGRWVLAAVDTPLLGLDAAYAVRDMGVTYEDFLAQVRCIWSQFLVNRICDSCATPADLKPSDLEYLFPGSTAPAQVLAAPGCAKCKGRPVAGRLAVSEVVVVTEAARLRISTALFEGTALEGDPEWHLTIHDQARRLLEEGAISVDAYRDTVRRNPLLRARNLLDRERAHSHRLGTVFEKFVSPEVKRRLMDSRTIDSVVKGESREVTCLFCDIRGFTSRAETLAPEDLFTELNSYFAEVVDCVLANEGTIDKFIGDALMVVFGAPLAQADQCERALRCALAIRERVAAFNAAHPARPPIAVGIGINSGMAMAGCVGTDRRMEYTVLGDAVNTAARLESRARAGQILVSAATRAKAGGRFVFGAARSFELKGKAADVEASELISAG